MKKLLRRLLFAHRQECAWCKRRISRGGLFAPAEVSHGICEPCSHTLQRQRETAGYWTDYREKPPTHGLELQVPKFLYEDGEE